MITAEELVLEVNNKEENKSFKLATVEELFENNTARLKFDGEDMASDKQYAYLDNYTPKVEDRVLLGVLGGTYVVLGKVNYNVGPVIEPDEEEVDRYLFDLKQVIMEQGLSVTGDVDIDGKMSSTTATVNGSLSAKATTVTSLNSSTITNTGILSVGGTANLNGNCDVSGTFRHRGNSIGFFSYVAQSRQTVSIRSSLSDSQKISNLANALAQYGLINVTT